MYEWMCLPSSLPYMLAVHGSLSIEVGSRERRQTQPPDLTDRWRAMYPSQHWSGQVKRYSKANTLSEGVEALTGNVDYILCTYMKMLGLSLLSLLLVWVLLQTSRIACALSYTQALGCSET